MSDFVYHKRLKKIFERCGGKNFKSEGIEAVRDRKKNFIPVFTSDLIDIPSEFKAYIQSDTACHGLGGTSVVLRIDYASTDDIFFGSESNDSQCLWFDSDGYCVPNGDIAFATIQPYLHPRPCSPLDTIPPMPTLEELQKCSIHYEGRKTIITYCDTFVGEAICHKDDKFNVESGIALAYSRAKEAKDEYDAKHREIMVGDTVKVVSIGSNFPTETSWLYDNIQNFSLVKKYAFGDFLMYSPDRFDNFTVLYIGQDKIAYIQNCKNEICRIIPIKALALV